MNYQSIINLMNKLSPDVKGMTSIEDLRKVYYNRVPRMFVDYCDSGSWTEQTYKNNESDFKQLYFRQKVLVDIAKRSLQTNLLGSSVNMPVAIAPTGLTGMQHADGEILAAKSAEQFGIPFTLSTMSICSIEDIAENTTQPFWFQLYMMKDRAFMENLIERAQQANCSALVLTADLQILGQRHKDLKNGLSSPPSPTLKNLINLATKPYWCLNMLNTNRRTFGNIVGHAKGVTNVNSLSKWTHEQFDPSLNWDDVAWVKSRWKGKLIIKGIMEVDDALRAVAAGADAIVVSNHGGRQLDGAPSSISVLPEIVKAVNQQTEIILDSGVRTGQDVLKSIALGAQGVMIGRAFLYGLGAYGQQGVDKVLEIIHKEAELSLGFCGLNSIDQVDESILRKPTYHSH